jgi:hypothetical protein
MVPRSNHMTGNRAVSAEFDENIAGSVRFGDNSVVQIRGRGTVAIAVHGYLSSIRGGYMSLWDHNNRLLAKVPCSPNRLYQITLQVAQPLCMAARSGGHAWLWHERLGHQNFGLCHATAWYGGYRRSSTSTSFGNGTRVSPGSSVAHHSLWWPDFGQQLALS